MTEGKLDITLLYENILVSELTDDLEVDGVPLMYDSDNPYMFCNIVNMSPEAYKQLGCSYDDVLVIKRYAKEEYLPGYYFISSKDVRGIIQREKYTSMVK